MSQLLSISDEACTRCGRCVVVCPAHIIKFQEKDSVPGSYEGAESFCINCGHCVAVCPQGALTHRSMSPDQCPSMQPEWLLSPAQAEHVLRSRRSTRVFTKQNADRDLLTRLIELAKYAPTGHNSQTVNWHIVYEADDVRKLAGLVVDWMRHTILETPQTAKGMNMDRVVAAWEKGSDRICRSAPHMILAHSAMDDRFAFNSCPIALSYLELAAPSFGLGSCWAGYFTAAARSWPPLQVALGLPDKHIVFGGVLVGYPQYLYKRLPLRNKPLITWQQGESAPAGP